MRKVYFYFSYPCRFRSVELKAGFQACRFEAQTAGPPHPQTHHPPAAPCPEALRLTLIACWLHPLLLLAHNHGPLPGGLPVAPFHSLLRLEMMLWVFHNEHWSPGCAGFLCVCRGVCLCWWKQPCQNKPGLCWQGEVRLAGGENVGRVLLGGFPLCQCPAGGGLCHTSWTLPTPPWPPLDPRLSCYLPTLSRSLNNVPPNQLFCHDFPLCSELTVLT